MPGFQFARIETYARSASKLRGSRRAGAGEKRGKGTGGWTARQVLAEALRETGACPHVENPEPPEVMLGDLVQLARQVDELERDPPQGQRRDTPILMAGVLSAPWPPGDERGIEWRMDSVHWLRSKWGDALKVVVAHNDESHDHLHFYVTAPGWGSVKGLHPGLQARKAAAAEGDAGKGQKAAFTAAMQRFQDEYQADVASRHGMARIGPARRRLTREAWRDEQQQAEALAAVRAKSARTAQRINEASEVFKSKVLELKQREAALARNERRIQDLAASLTPIEEERAAKRLAEIEEQRAKQKASQRQDATPTAPPGQRAGLKPRTP